MRNVLTIAGSDCSGGAGLQADLKTFAACGVYGMSVVTALTAQNTLGVHGVQTVGAEFVGDQIEAIFSDIPLHAVKIGMLSSPAVMQVVAQKLAQYSPQWIIVDPVMVSKSGHPLMPAEAVDTFRELLLPLATILTPNRPEVVALTGVDPRSRADIERAAQRLFKWGTQAVLFKGGHCEGPADDILVVPEGLMVFAGERLEAKHTHGTGCSLSSALASYVALGYDLGAAVRRAKHYVTEGIRHAHPLGQGIGPIHHFWNLWDHPSDANYNHQGGSHEQAQRSS